MIARDFNSRRGFPVNFPNMMATLGSHIFNGYFIARRPSQSIGIVPIDFSVLLMTTTSQRYIFCEIHVLTIISFSFRCCVIGKLRARDFSRRRSHTPSSGSNSVNTSEMADCLKGVKMVSLSSLPLRSG